MSDVNKQQAARLGLNDSFMADEAFVTEDELNLGKILAEGSFGKVYEGTFNGSPCAIKIMKVTNPESATTKILIKSLRTEMALMSKFHHPYVISFFGASLLEGMPCLIMELCLGGSYWHALHRKPDKQLTTKQKMVVLKQAALGMVYLHSRKPPLMHKDLKGLNILLHGSGDAKVTDFGISDANKEARVGRGGFVGTVPYMAPEMLVAGSNFGLKVDTYGFACVLFETLAVKIPWQGADQQTVVKNVVTSKTRPEIPVDKQELIRQEPQLQELEALMQRCWQQNPAERPTFDQVCAAEQHVAICFVLISWLCLCADIKGARWNSEVLWLSTAFVGVG
jgi:serine/threonine protein kinase